MIAKWFVWAVVSCVIAMSAQSARVDSALRGQQSLDARQFLNSRHRIKQLVTGLQEELGAFKSKKFKKFLKKRKKKSEPPTQAPVTPRPSASAATMSTWCGDGDQVCLDSATLHVESTRFIETFNKAFDELESLVKLFESLALGHSLVMYAYNLRPLLQMTLEALSKTPYIGPILFKVPAVAMKNLKTPMEKLKDKSNDVQNKIAKPWEKSIFRMIELSGKALAGLLTVIPALSPLMGNGASARTGLTPMFEGAVCMAPSLDSATGGAISALVDGLEVSVGATAVAISKLNDGLDVLVGALTSEAYKALKDGLSMLNKAIHILCKPLELLEPLNDFLEKTITIPWFDANPIGNYKPGTCPSGYTRSNFGVYCVSDCPDGFAHDATKSGVCYSTCPSGYRDLGGSCQNPHFMVRKLKSKVKFQSCSVVREKHWYNPLKWRWRNVNKCVPKTGCPKGYTTADSGTHCWEKCNLADRNTGSLLETGHKSNPLDAILDATKKKLEEEKQNKLLAYRAKFVQDYGQTALDNLYPGLLPSTREAEIEKFLIDLYLETDVSESEVESDETEDFGSSDWRKQSFGVTGVCWKRCPSNLIEETVTSMTANCLKKSKTVGTAALQCPAGYESTGDGTSFLCKEKCPFPMKTGKVPKELIKAGLYAIPLGAVIDNFVSFCFSETVTTKRVKIKEVTALFDDATDTIKELSLGLYATIEKGIGEAIKAALGELGDLLGFRTEAPFKLPTLPANMNKILSFDALLSALDSVDVSALHFDVTDLFMEQPLEKASKALGFAPGVFSDLECLTNTSCLVGQLGLGGKVLPPGSNVDKLLGKVQNFYQSNVDMIAGALVNVTEAFDFSSSTCTKNETIKVPIENAMRKVFGQKTSGKACDAEFSLCTAFNFGDAEKRISSVLQRFKELMAPLISVVASAFDAASGSPPTLLETLATSSASSGDFLMACAMFPVAPPLQIKKSEGGFGAYTAGGLTAADLKLDGKTFRDWTKGKAQTQFKGSRVHGAHVSTGPNKTWLRLYCGREDGKDVVKAILDFSYRILNVDRAKGGVRETIRSLREKVRDEICQHRCCPGRKPGESCENEDAWFDLYTKWFKDKRHPLVGRTPAQKNFMAKATTTQRPAMYVFTTRGAIQQTSQKNGLQDRIDKALADPMWPDALGGAQGPNLYSKQKAHNYGLAAELIDEITETLSDVYRHKYYGGKGGLSWIRQKLAKKLANRATTTIFLPLFLVSQREKHYSLGSIQLQSTIKYKDFARKGAGFYFRTFLNPNSYKSEGFEVELYAPSWLIIQDQDSFDSVRSSSEKLVDQHFEVGLGARIGLGSWT